MRILGIDPGTTIIGYGIIETTPKGFSCVDYGVFRTPSNVANQERVVSIYNFFEALVKKHQPDKAGIEKLFFFKNAQTINTPIPSKTLPILSPTPSEKQNRASSISQPNPKDLGEIGTAPKITSIPLPTSTPTPSFLPNPTNTPIQTPSPSVSTYPTMSPSVTPTPTPQQSGKININTASNSELDKITGVGPTIAQRIIDYRNTNGPFQKIEDLKNVKGIGDVNFEKMKNEITI